MKLDPAIVEAVARLPTEPFAFLRVHPDDGVTVVPDDSRKPGSIVFRVYSEGQIAASLTAAAPLIEAAALERLAAAIEACGRDFFIKMDHIEIAASVRAFKPKAER